MLSLSSKCRQQQQQLLRMTLRSPPSGRAAAAAAVVVPKHLTTTLSPPRSSTTTRYLSSRRGMGSPTLIRNKIYTIDGSDDTAKKLSKMSKEDIQKIIEEEEEKMEREYLDKFVRDDIHETWKPGERKRKLVKGHDLKEFEYEMYPERFLDPATNEPMQRWTLRNKRCGALGIKIGMVPVWDNIWGERHPCTVLYLDKNIVLGHKTIEKHGYMGIQVAAGERKAKNVGKCLLGQYRPIGIQPYTKEYYNSTEEKINHPPYLVREFRITDPSYYIPVGEQIHARHFVPGQNVDISGISKGKGFQGAMKRHGFGGMPASHGTSKSHRALGSTGQCQDPGKVFKGKKMAGRMGTDRVTVQNLRIVKVDRGKNLLYIKGAIPGNKGSFVEIKDAVKKPLWDTKLVADEIDRPPLPTYTFDTTVDGTGLSGYEEFMPVLDEDPLDPDYRDSQTVLEFKDAGE